MNKEELIEKIKGLEGLDNDEKAELIGSLRKTKKYGLVWENHPEEVEERLRTSLPVLTEVKEKAILNSSPSGESEGGCPNHILIEGDNLEALTALTYTHEGKIDVIYIDPPYNTGNKDFVYNDSFVDTEDGYRHSKWLSFMEKRLRMAKKLMSDKGVIFISIDDNEQANLKLLCDEIIGMNNLIGVCVWLRKKKGSNLSKEFRKITEYVLIYKNSSEKIELFGEKAYAEKLVPLLNRPNKETTIYIMGGTTYVGTDVKTDCIKAGKYGEGELTVYLANDIHIVNGIITNDYSIKGRFRWSQDTIDDEIRKGSRFYLSKSLRINIARFNQGDKYKAVSSLIGVSDNIGTNEDATNELRNIFAEQTVLPFDFPKPTTLIKYLINSATAEMHNATILDFFAGSGTTLHATMQLNAEDGGHRQCILVTNNENNICEEVTYERNKRVIKGYTTPKGVEVEGLKANKLRYYKTEFLPRENSFEAKQNLMRKCVDMLCIKENIYTEVREFCGMKFKPSLLRYFKEHGRQMLLIFDERVIEHIVPLIREKAEGKLKVYVFSNGAYAYEDEFLTVADKVEVCALPEAILQVYNKILPQQEEEVMI